MFAGRWNYLKVQFLYLFANLRTNGGIIDRIMYMMIKYDHTTHDHLLKLASTINALLQYKAVVINYMGHAPYKPPAAFSLAYYDIIEDVLKNPNNRYFKIDDDVIYIHPGTFESMIRREKNTPCTVRLGNIAGANWRCSYIHQSMGLFNDPSSNPKRLKFDFDIHAECGWKSLNCAKVSLNTFLSLYTKQQLDKYIFNGIISLEDKMRFSINFFMIDNGAINFRALLESGPIQDDDEHWWTSHYVRKTDPHCVVGGALVVHFSYFTTANALLNSTLMSQFENIAFEMHRSTPYEVWQVLQ